MQGAGREFPQRISTGAPTARSNPPITVSPKARAAVSYSSLVKQALNDAGTCYHSEIEKRGSGCGRRDQSR
jgi:hypothetical protein